MSEVLLDYENVDFNDVIYTMPEKRNRKHVSDIWYQVPETPIYIQTPKLRCSEVTVEDDGTGYLLLDMEQNSFYEFFLNFDEAHKQTVRNNSMEWFKGKTFSKGKINDSYKSIILPPKTKDGSPRLALQLTPETEFYNQYRTSVTASEVVSNVEKHEYLSMVAILRIKGLWITSNCIGSTVEIVQMKVYEKKQKLTGYLICDDDDDEDEEELEPEPEPETEPGTQENSDIMVVTIPETGTSN